MVRSFCQGDAGGGGGGGVMDGAEYELPGYTAVTCESYQHLES